MKFLTLLVVALFTTTAAVSNAQVVESPTREQPTTPEGWLRFYAEEYGVNPETMVTVARCESSLNPKAVGDSGQSRGLVQIYRPAHPHVTDEQAFDPAFAAEFMAKNIKNNPKMWSCWSITGYPPVV